MDLSRRFRLRADTRRAHQRLDAAIAPLFRDRDAYGLYLSGAWRARACLEASVLAANSPLPLGLLTPTAPALAADLDDLGLAAEPGAWPGEGEIPLGLADQWGVGYVLAGSALGAVHLLTWASALDLSAAFGARHLAAQAAQAKLWPQFVAKLDAAPFSPEDERRCSDAAVSAFETFAEALALTPHA